MTTTRSADIRLAGPHSYVRGFSKIYFPFFPVASIYPKPQMFPGCDCDTLPSSFDILWPGGNLLPVTLFTHGVSPFPQPSSTFLSFFMHLFSTSINTALSLLNRLISGQHLSFPQASIHCEPGTMFALLMAILSDTKVHWLNMGKYHVSMGL